MMFALTLDQLADCPDAEAYANLVMPMLWTHFYPAILSISASRIIFRILNYIFHDV